MRALLWQYGPMNTRDREELYARATAQKWERERANEGSYERWLAQSKGRVAEAQWVTDTAIRRADKLAVLQRLRRVVREG
jgi:hypothetical protein